MAVGGKPFSVSRAGAGGSHALGKVKLFFRDLETRGELDDYFALAKEHVRAERGIFTGSRTHHALAPLFPCGDAGYFPSIVNEAGPRVCRAGAARGGRPRGPAFGALAGGACPALAAWRVGVAIGGAGAGWAGMRGRGVPGSPWERCAASRMLTPWRNAQMGLQCY